MGSQEDELDWPGIKAAALQALDAAILIAGRSAKGVLVQQHPVPWPPDHNRLTLVPGPARGVYWRDCQYFAVDADLSDRPPHRQPLEQPVFNPKTRTLRLDVPAATRDALAAVTRVRVYRVDDQDLKLKLKLRAALTDVTRGPRIADLWSRGRRELMPSSARQQLNEGQRRALAAMTSEGGCFVWGPPGTGKTTVITSAVRDALQHGRSVLLSSHTHVAVDNVLEALMAEDAKAGRPLLELGAVVRNPPADETKILPSVRDHPHLLLDKAAAAAVNLVERSESLRAASRENEGNPTRVEEPRLRNELDDAGIDVVEVRALRKVVETRELLCGVRAELEEAADHEREAAARSAEKTAALHQVAGAADERRAIEGLLGQAKDLLAGAAVAVEESERSCAVERRRLAEARAVRTTAAAAAQLKRAMILPWTASRRRRDLAASDVEVVSREEAYAAATAGLRVAEREQTLRRRQISDLEPRLERAVERAHAESVAASELDRAVAAAHAAKAAADRLRSAEAALQQVPTDPDHETRIARLQDLGAFVLVTRYNSVLQKLAELDEELAELKKAEEKLKDEYQATRLTLLAEAPVIATTLTSLASNRELAKRRFDVVIIDEAASAEAASIVYAGSRADRTLALVGDFLQNAPIAEVDDAVDDETRRIVAWQSKDIFGLAGIHDRWTAERHPRCVALVRQYRYPSIVGDVVNAFCYAGLLESDRPSKDSDGRTITFIDTSGGGVHLEPRNGSWVCRPTQAAALLLAQRLVTEHPADTLGFVSPYAPQALAMESAFDRAGLAVQAGTAHRFQGREFTRVIIDLMQDDRPRWVAAADLSGPARAVSAAKLLNVALTRGRTQIFLIGSWPFVVGCDSPGMRALAGLEGKANFERRGLGDLG